MSQLQCSLSDYTGQCASDFHWLTTLCDVLYGTSNRECGLVLQIILLRGKTNACTPREWTRCGGEWLFGLRPAMCTWSQCLVCILTFTALELGHDSTTWSIAYPYEYNYRSMLSAISQLQLMCKNRRNCLSFPAPRNHSWAAEDNLWLSKINRETTIHKALEQLVNSKSSPCGKDWQTRKNQGIVSNFVSVSGIDSMRVWV
jgi:hypothetical protein